MLNLLQAVAYHGWGFDHTCWQGWCDRLASLGGELLVGDRGYFGQPIDPEARRIILAHSYGLHLCPPEQLQAAELLILFNSFLSFHPLADPGRRRSLAMVTQMATQFAVQPAAVLATFKAKCYYPVPWSSPEPVELNPDLLLADLNALNRCALDISLLRTIPRILILQGAQDRIVSAAKGRELWQHLPDNSQYIEIEQAGHGLPFTHPEVCWSWIGQRLG